jgi:hypothetical protein
MYSHGKVAAFFCVIVTMTACGSRVQPSTPAQRLADEYADGIQIGMSVAEAREIFPGLRWRPYWGWSADFAERRGGYDSFGIQALHSPGDSATSAKIDAIHLFARDTSALPPDLSGFPQAKRREGCGGLNGRIQVLYWEMNKAGVVWTRNPDAAEASPSVHLVLTKEKPKPQRHVTRFSPHPCS